MIFCLGNTSSFSSISSSLCSPYLKEISNDLYCAQRGSSLRQLLCRGLIFLLGSSLHLWSHEEQNLDLALIFGSFVLFYPTPCLPQEKDVPATWPSIRKVRTSFPLSYWAYCPWKDDPCSTWWQWQREQTEENRYGKSGKEKDQILEQKWVQTSRVQKKNQNDKETQQRG